MGREWHWGGGSTKASRSWRVYKARGRREDECQEQDPGRLPVGCMRAVFRLLEFPLSFHNGEPTPQSSSSAMSSTSSHMDDVGARKGYEAPRNSLDVDHKRLFRSNALEEEALEILKRQASIKIKTGIGVHKKAPLKELNGSRPYPYPSEPDNPNSPSCRTPNVVARLMGLDLLPEGFSSPPSMSFRRTNMVSARRGPSRRWDSDITGVRSLPETPRVSASRRSDVDHHHRLSLQINKENMSLNEENVLARVSAALKRKKASLTMKENLDLSGKCNSPGSYARQIVKQMKESVSRRVGQEITNTVNDRSSESHYNKPKSGGSPRLMNLDIEAKLSRSKIRPPTTALPSDTPLSAAPPAKALSRSTSQENEQLRANVLRKRTPKKMAGKIIQKGVALTAGNAIRSKHEEFFVRSTATCSTSKANQRSKKMPLPPANLLPPVKKNPPSAAKSSKQELKDLKPSSLRSRRESRGDLRAGDCGGDARRLGDSDIKPIVCRCITPAVSVTVNSEAERDYIVRLIQHAGERGDCHFLSRRSSSRSHPLDLSMFYHLENFTNVASAYPGPLSKRWNRKLLFQLIDEILTEMMNSSSCLRRLRGCQIGAGQMKVPDLVDVLCARVRTFHDAVEGPDGINDGDMFPACELLEGGLEKLVIDIENHILESLVHETTLVLVSSRDS